MINISTRRYERDDSPCDGPHKFKYSVGRALKMLFNFDIGFGGVLCKMDVDNANVSFSMRTRCFGRYDITQYSGTRKDMKLLVLVIHLLRELNTNQKFVDAIYDDAWEQLKGSSTLIIVHSMGMLTGFPRVRLLVCSVVMREAKTEEAIQQFVQDTRHVPVETMVELLHLHLDEGIPFMDLVQDESLWKEEAA